MPRTAVGVIIGKSGETIKRLTVETGAKIQFKQGIETTSSFLYHNLEWSPVDFQTITTPPNERR